VDHQGDEATGEVAISLDGVTKVFPGSTAAAVDELSLEVPKGSLTALVGPSGCGKTTTLKMINRLIEPTSGRIVVDGRDVRDRPVHELRRDIGYVIQQVGLFPHQTVATNIGTVPRLLGWDKRRVTERVGELVELVGLDERLLRRYPAELSGGQQQRVGVARALAADPPVLLMDEPYSAVDPIVRTHLQDELLRLQEQVQKTIVLVTHDIDEAIKLADRIAILAVGGVLEQYGTPEELLRRPANEFVERFLGRERGLKRMALLKVADVPLSPGAVVAASATPAEAKEVMARFGVDWVGVLDDDRLRGWVGAADLDGLEQVGDAPVERFVSWVTPATALREALDTIVTSRTRAAVVLDDERYVGMVFIDQIAEGVE
jgi:osmoprotectant transport system ATP-binding protein